MKFMPVMCLPQDVNISPFVQLYVQLPMKHHKGAFSISLDNPTLVPASPGPVYMRRQVRAIMTEAFLDEVEMLQANAHYVHVRYLEDSETTVATKHLAPQLLPLDMLQKQRRTRPMGREILNTHDSTCSPF